MSSVEDKGSGARDLCFDAKCYLPQHVAQGSTGHTVAKMIVRVSFMLYIDVKPPEYKGRFATEGEG